MLGWKQSCSWNGPLVSRGARGAARRGPWWQVQPALWGLGARAAQLSLGLLGASTRELRKARCVRADGYRPQKELTKSGCDENGPGARRSKIA